MLWALALVSMIIAVVTVMQVLYASSLEIEAYASSILSSSTNFDVNAVNSDIAVWVIAIDNALMDVAFFSLFLSLGVLRWKEGSFTVRALCFWLPGSSLTS